MKHTPNYTHPTDLPPMEPLRETQVKTKTVTQGRVIVMRQDEARLPDGQLAHRDVIEHPGGVVILPVLDDGRIILLQQWRYALERPLLEVPAGKLDGEELPLPAAQRELLEETGYTASHWDELTYIYTSPGFCDERLWLFEATGLTLVDETPKGDGEENIQEVILTPEQIKQKIASRQIVDAKTLSVLFWLFCN